MLGVEFHRIGEGEEPRVSFTNTINSACQQLADLYVSELFTTLLWLMQNYWSHPTLVCMMKGDELDEETGERCKDVNKILSNCNQISNSQTQRYSWDFVISHMFLNCNLKCL